MSLPAGRSFFAGLAARTRVMLSLLILSSVSAPNTRRLPPPVTRGCGARSLRACACGLPCEDSQHFGRKAHSTSIDVSHKKATDSIDVRPRGLASGPTYNTAMKTRVVDRAHAPFQLVIRRSRIHRLGVFAGEAIPPRCKVIEFTGERITFEEARRRWSPTLNYLFGLGDNLLIDGAAGGSGAEYINHSCAPTLHARIVRGHLLYFASRAIAKGEELTVDYKYAGGGKQTHPCHCGADSCRGTMILVRRDSRRSRVPRRPRA
jgi:hypothetical protein